MATGGIKVHIYGDYDDKDIKKAHRDLDSLSNQSGVTSDRMAMLGKAFLAAGIAAGAMAVKFGIDGVQAAIADEAAAAKLAQTMLNVGLAHDTAQVETMIDALQRETGVADDELRPAYARLVTSLQDTGRATDALKLAMDVSAGTGKSLETVVAALGKAYDGNTGGLSRLGAGIDKAILKSGNMEQITAALAARFAGQAATAADTYQGKIARLSVGFDELKESFGYGFLAGLGGAEAGISDLTETIKKMEPALRATGEQLGSAITTLSDLVGFVTSAKSAWDGFLESLGPTGKWVSGVIDDIVRFLNPLTRLVDAINAAINAYRRLTEVSNVSATYTGPANPAPFGNKPTSRPEYNSQVPQRAAGGPVKAGSMYLVGEDGPELLMMGNQSGTIIPNGGTSRSSTGGGNSYTITVQAGVGDPRMIGQQVVEYIKRYEQANGAVFAAA
jgi:ABC-type transporter Mla subunit MlaD